MYHKLTFVKPVISQQRKPFWKFSSANFGSILIALKTVKGINIACYVSIKTNPRDRFLIEKTDGNYWIITTTVLVHSEGVPVKFLMSLDVNSVTFFQSDKYLFLCYRSSKFLLMIGCYLGLSSASNYRVATLQPRSNSLCFPWVFPVLDNFSLCYFYVINNS